MGSLPLEHASTSSTSSSSSSPMLLRVRPRALLIAIAGFLVIYMFFFLYMQQSVLNAATTTSEELQQAKNLVAQADTEAKKIDDLDLDHHKDNPLNPPSFNVEVNATDPSMKDNECFRSRDYGILKVLQETATSYCLEPARGDAIPSTYTYYHSSEADFRCTKFQNLQLDLRKVKISRHINDISKDGADHDPRFRYSSRMAICSCLDEQVKRGPEEIPPRVWRDVVDHDPVDEYVVCNSKSLSKRKDTNIKFTDVNVVLLARRDDHNPFFQVATTLNAWMMLQVLGWNTTNTQLVYLDKGFQSPVDTLQKAILSPNHEVIAGEKILGQVVHFDSVLIAPFETWGVMMSHLDDDQPCFRNQLIQDFRSHALVSLQIAQHKANPKSCLITIITRRPYKGRIIQRQWRNEDEIIVQMREEYKGIYKYGECVFEAREFVDMTQEEQMQTMIESDIVIGMHGAGLVNVLWTRPETLIVEIFPKKRKRYGYRNICQYTGCNYHEFRGGKDISTGRGANANDKSISYNEWKRFFDPLFRNAIYELERRNSDEYMHR